MTLYKRLKPHLEGIRAAISDEEFLILDRKDYHHSQISGVNAWINEFGIKIGYPYRLLLAHLEQVATALVSEDFNILLSTPTLTFAGFYGWVRAGGGGGKGKVYAPNGIAKLSSQSKFTSELIGQFNEMTDRRPESKPIGGREVLFTFVIGNTKDSGQTTFAVDRFCEVSRGMLILKDYAKIDALDEREYMEARRLFPLVTLEGHAIVLKGI